MNRKDSIRSGNGGGDKGGKKDAAFVNNKNGSTCKGVAKDAAKSLLVLARQDTQMAQRQKLLQIFLQIGASLNDIKEVYEMSPRSLTLDVLFEAGKLGSSQKILKFLSEKLEKDFSHFDGLAFYYTPSWYKTSFTLQKDPHLLTSGSIPLGLRQVLLSTIVTLKACSPDSGKPFWNLREFMEFFGETTKSKYLKTLHFTFPKDYTPPKQATPAFAAAPAAAAAANDVQNHSTELQHAPAQPCQNPQQLTQLQLSKESKKVRVMLERMKVKMGRKKLESCVLQEIRIKFDYSHKTFDCLLQMVHSLGNLPNLKAFALQVHKEAAHPKDFKQFKAALPQAIGRLVSTSKTLEILIVDAQDWKTESDWEPLLKPLERNPSLKRLLIRGFKKSTCKTLPRGYTKHNVLHMSLESFKGKLITILEQHNMTLTDIRFVIPACQCDRKFTFDADDCFKPLDDAKLACSPCLSKETTGECMMPTPKSDLRLAHLLMLNTNGRAKLADPGLTYRNFFDVITRGDKFIDSVAILYSLLRERAEYVPMLSSHIYQSTKDVPYEIDELYLAAAGKLSLPLERFVDLCVRRSDDFSAFYDLLRPFPTIWLDHLRTSKQIIQEQTKRAKKDYVSVVDLVERTQIVMTDSKTVITGTKTHCLPVYTTRMVKTINQQTSKKHANMPLKVIRLNVAPSVGGATLTKFPKLVIGPKGQLVVQRKKKSEETKSSSPTINSERDASGAAMAPRKVLVQDRSNQRIMGGDVASACGGIIANAQTRKRGIKILKDKSNQASSSPNPKKAKAATKTTKHQMSQTLNAMLEKKKAKILKLLKMDGLEKGNFYAIEDDAFYSPCRGKNAAAVRRSITRRKIKPAERTKSESSLAELIGDDSDEGDRDKSGGDDSDWDDPDDDDADEGDEWD